MTQGNTPSPYPGAPQGQDPQNPAPPQAPAWGAPPQDQGGWQQPQSASQASPYAAPASSPYGSPASASTWQEVPQQAQPAPAAGSSPFGASPAGAPFATSPAGAGYPGAFGAAGGQDGVAWKRIRTFGLVMIVLSVLAVLARLIVDLAYLVGAGAAQEAQLGIQSGGAVGLGLVNILIGGGGVVLAFALFILAIIVAVTARERARVGGIVVAVAVPLAAIAFWLVSFLGGFIAGASGMTMGSTLTPGAVRLVFGLDLVRVLVIAVIYLVGSYFVFSTAKKKLSA